MTTIIITVLSGVLVFVISQIFIEFCLRPIQEFKRLKADVARGLIYHAQYYSNPILPEEFARNDLYKQSSDEIRKLSSEVAACAQILPPRWATLGFVPRTEDIIEAADNLMGISNSYLSASDGMEITRQQTIACRELVKSKLKIVK